MEGPRVLKHWQALFGHFVFHDASSGVATYVRAPTVGDERWWWETVLASSM